MYQTVTITENTKITAGFFRMMLRAPALARESQPGQFVMLKGWTGNAPFLMRPISINFADADEGTVTFLYKVAGEGTALLSALPAGATMQVLGPLGHGFPLDAAARRIALIGRGIGIAPLRFLAARARAQETEVYAYLSAKEDRQIFDRAELEALGVTVRFTSDSACNVTGFFAQDLETLPFDAAYSCGSNRLMREMHALHLRYGFSSYVSLEEHMACGIGACKGCVCKTHDADGREQYETVCKCGPVFSTERIV